MIENVVLIALATVGLLEAFKKALGETKVLGWIWPILMVAVSIGVSISTLVPPLFYGLLAAAIAQLAYPVLVKLPETLIGKLKDGK